MGTRLYDKIPLNQNLVLDTALFEGAGSLVHDISRYHQNLAFHIHGSPTWEQLASRYWAIRYGGDLSGDFLECPAALSTELNFTNEDFTLLAWVNSDLAAGGSDEVLVQGEVNVCGFEFYVTVPGLKTISLRCNQGGSRTGIESAGTYLMGQWTLIGVDRQGAWGQFYVNGLPAVTTLGAGLIDPVAAVAEKIHIGIQHDEVNNTFEGMIGRVRAWKNRMLGSAVHYSVWEEERALYGV